MHDLLFAVTLGAALGSGLIAGVFFAFSTFVMRALSRLEPAHAIAAMQSINRAVLNRWFLGVFLGTAAACVLVGAAALMRAEPGAAFRLAGGGLYVAGAVLVTMLGNVPLNTALAAVDPAGADAGRRWADYRARWTLWNHLRTVAALLAAASLTVALAAGSGPAR